MQGVAVPQLKPGDKAGRYELLLQIAQGGMGAVWVARLKLENGFEKLFAVKTLLTHLADQTVFRQMFLDEARIAAGIEHPNVGQILDLGEQGDLLYLVMEWVEGESVNALARGAAVENRKLPYGVSLRMLADACAGLHAVHEHRDREGRPLEIVHRDVSPHNMLVSSRGITKVIDFGVAKARDRLTGATQSGAVKGKLRYMAPEQALGKQVDRRADVWGIGAVLYTLVSGRYPFPGETDVDVLRAMMAGNAPAPLPPAVPPPIERVVRRALSLDPEQRYPTAAALGEDMENAARELGVITSQHGVAAYIEEHAGARLAKLRAAIHSAIEDRDSMYDTVKRRSSVDYKETTNSRTIVDIEQPTTGSQSGTLMGTTAFDTKTAGISRLWSTQKSVAALGAVALLGVIFFLVVRATSDRNTIPSASAASADGIPPAQAIASPPDTPAEPKPQGAIDLDPPVAVAPPAPVAPVARPAAAAPVTPPPRTTEPVAPTPEAPAEKPKSREPDATSVTRNAPPKERPSSTSTSGATSPKKRPVESAIDTRR